jgi:short-chain fatty acids transporter
MAASERHETPLQRALNAYARGFQMWLPSPFAIAVLLTGVAGLLALRSASPIEVLDAWVDGLWNPGLIRFAFQAMFMLVLGHVLALAPPVLRALEKAVDWVVWAPENAPAKVALLSMVLGWLNWGLGLIAGAILVRGVLDRRRREAEDSRLARVSAGLLGAAGYTGLLVWHGGLGGSAPLKVAESGHLASLVPNASWASELPEALTLSQTALSGWSQAVTWTVVSAVVVLFAWLGRKVTSEPGECVIAERPEGTEKKDRPEFGLADALDRRRGVAYALGVACLGGAVLWASSSGPWTKLAFVTPDWINMVLLGSAMLAHGQVRGMLRALDDAISGASGILVQFPLYFGIMGMVSGTGLGTWLSESLVGATSAAWLPEALFVSSGVLNVFVPSGGGQWAVQGPLVLEACHALGVPLERGIMAMAFGDELTNMLQPFWALPLLGITGLSARDILPYTLMAMGLAGTVMVSFMAFWS